MHKFLFLFMEFKIKIAQKLFLTTLKYICLFLVISNLLSSYSSRISNLTDIDENNQIFLKPTLDSSQSAILIDGNIELLNFPGKTGSGIESDPFIIENLNFDSESAEAVFTIKNTDVYLTIRNCRFQITNESQEGFGVLFENVKNIDFNNNSLNYLLEAVKFKNSMNISIKFNNISNCALGITVLTSSNLTISNNTLKNNYGGIEIFDSITSLISYNRITAWSEHYGSGILISSCFESNISNNKLFGNGINILLSNDKSKEENRIIVNSTKIEETNILNNLPIYSYNSINNLNTNNFTNAGQIILVNCNNSIIENFEFLNVSCSIQIFFSNENIIDNCSFRDVHSVGIGIYYSDNNLIIKNQLISTEFNGIFLKYSNFNNVTKNSIKLECVYPLTLEKSNYNNITFNKLNSRSYYQIYLIYSNYNTVRDNDACVTEEYCGINYIFDEICDRSILDLLIWFILIPIIIFGVLIVLFVKKIKKRAK